MIYPEISDLLKKNNIFEDFLNSLQRYNSHTHLNIISFVIPENQYKLIQEETEKFVNWRQQVKKGRLAELIKEYETGNLKEGLPPGFKASVCAR